MEAETKPRKLKTTDETMMSNLPAGLLLVALLCGAAYLVTQALDASQEATLGAILGIAGAFLFWGGGRMATGNVKEAERLRRSGTPGIALVTAARETGSESNSDPQMEIELEVSDTGASDGHWRLKRVIPTAVFDRIVPGVKAPIYVDPQKPDFAFVDWEAIEVEKQEG